jgi:IS30 family transposase
MDRNLLERYLKQGLSLTQIGALVDRDPSTVGYWVQKHGLVANGREKYAPRGGLAREELERLIGQGASAYAIARELKVSVSTVRHWLRRYGLRTKPAIRRAQVRAMTKAANCGLSPPGSHEEVLWALSSWSHTLRGGTEGRGVQMHPPLRQLPR